MRRRSFLASIGAAVAAWFAPKLPALPAVVAAQPASPAAGAFLAAKAAEIDALYADMARNLAISMWGDHSRAIGDVARNEENG